ncbi:putative transporter YojE [Propionispora sp. 2/2-37]|uniref:EamA family transporter RarD n=1 Tax=Propionispora sp. 2/2-37 TaxID=1677858 RepID=UPI0006BB56E0|nr:EamA family transporter RarD [Propionispora sp. 2/2-37]CUH94816.1 putative transporter YojE [Propionispora sp. 2/2-37]
MKTTTIGIAYAAGAYAIWGILPAYWKLVAQVPAYEILAHRIFWSFIFMILVVVLAKHKKQFYTEVCGLVSERKKLLAIIMGSILISINWLIYIWAVNNNQIIETSLGYYINPLFSIFLGILILKERLSFGQILSVVLAAMGVLNMTLQVGKFPWVALSLAVSFGLYGLCKKITDVSAITSITLETCIVTPLALLYLVYLEGQGGGMFSAFTPTAALLAGTGVVTAIPLLLFAGGAKKLTLTILGFIQYLSPTIALLLGIFLYHETFTAAHLVSFAFIWSAIVLFSLSQGRWFVQKKALLKNIAVTKERN